MKPKGQKDKITSDIEQVYGVLSETGKSRKIYARISWNGRDGKSEIRSTFTNSDGEEIVGKGISLSDDEMDVLIDAYQKKKADEAAHAPVNFDDVFASAPDIVEKREQGYDTENGKIILHESEEHAKLVKEYNRKRGLL